jgi:hypothetical protein
MRVPFDPDRAGMLVVLILTVLTLALLAVIGALNLAAEDLHLQVETGHGEASPAERSPVGQWLSARLAADVSPADYTALETRAGELDQRADRLLEATGVVALAGMLIWLVTARPASVDERTREGDASSPVASTSSNGTV